MCGRHHDHDHDHEDSSGLERLCPLGAAPDPGYPARASRGGALRKAAAATTVGLALALGACGGEEPAENVAAGRIAFPPHRPTVQPPDLDGTMNGTKLGLPLALALASEERSPGSASAAHPGDGGGGEGGEGGEGGGTPGSGSGAHTPVINLAPLDANLGDVTAPTAKPRPRPIPVRMSGCSGMARLRR